MSVNHAISDLVATLKNGQMANKKIVAVDLSKLRKAVLEILKEEGYISSYRDSEDGRKIEIELKYHKGQPVIRDIKVVSKPGKRIYKGIEDVPVVYDGLGLCVVSTSKGVLPDYKARELGVGGEVLMKIF